MITPSPTANAQDVTAKHTPGPWRVAGDNLPECIQVENSEGDFIAQCEDRRGFASLDAVANARLIAAAPGLLEACISARMQLRVAVIAHSGGLYDHENVSEHLGVAKLDAAIAKATAA